jgi:hypothetical protein
MLVLFACLAIGRVALFADEYKQLGKQIAAAACFASNWMGGDVNGVERLPVFLLTDEAVFRPA